MGVRYGGKIVRHKGIKEPSGRGRYFCAGRKEALP